MTILSYLHQLIRPPVQTDDPKDWPRRKKNVVVFTIAYCAFVAPLASSIYMPAVLQVKEDLNTTSDLVSATLSVYVLFMGIMPVFWASLCDYYGRRPIYLVSMLIFIVGSLFAAISGNIWVFFVMRAIQAFGSSSVLSVGGGSLSDIFHSGERGTAFGLFYLGPLIAPMIGPIIGGVISQNAGWRSTMWLLLGTAVLAFLLVLFVLPETYRHRIDKAPVQEDQHSSGVEDDAHEKDLAPVSPHSGIHSTHSDPTLVASRSSLHQHQDQHPYTVPHHHSHHHHQVLKRTTSIASSVRSPNREDDLPVESAVEFMVPNFVPPFLMSEDPVEEDKEAEEDQEKGENEKGNLATETKVISQTCSGTAVSIPATTTSPTTAPHHHQDNEQVDPNEALKRKPFNPLRPLLCLRQPTNALLVGFNALALGAQFCMNNTLPISFNEVYHLSETTIGLCFCAGGFGSVMGSLLGGRYSDYVMRRWLIKQELAKQRDQRDRDAMFAGGRSGLGDEGSAKPELTKKEIMASVSVSMRAPPEVRLQSVWLGVFVLPLGLMLFGWSVQKGLPLVAPLIAIFLVGFGMMMVFSSTTTALVDANSDGNMATSAVACNSFARGVTGAIGGFAALPMMGAMGSGWLYTFWAIMTLVGSAGLVLMVFRAKDWRQKQADKALNRV